MNLLSLTKLFILFLLFILVQGIKYKIEAKASDVHRFRRVGLLRNQQDAVKCTKFTTKCAKTGLNPSVNHFNYFFTYENGA